MSGQAIYNNTANNPLNPNTPPQAVHAGKSTTDEMMLFFFAYTNYEVGDENLMFDTITYTHTYQNCNYTEGPSEVKEVPEINAKVFPNPTSGWLDIAINGAAEYCLTVTDIEGKPVIRGKVDRDHSALDISQLADGLYFITLTSGGLKTRSYKIIKG